MLMSQEKNPELVENGSSESFSTDNLANFVDEQCVLPMKK